MRNKGAGTKDLIVKKKEYIVPQVDAFALQLELMNANSPQLENPEPGGEIDPWAKVPSSIDVLF